MIFISNAILNILTVACGSLESKSLSYLVEVQEGRFDFHQLEHRAAV